MFSYNIYDIKTIIVLNYNRTKCECTNSFRETSFCIQVIELITIYNTDQCITVCRITNRLPIWLFCQIYVIVIM